MRESENFCFNGGVTVTTMSMGTANRMLGYTIAFLFASVLYIVWFTLVNHAPGSDVTILFRVGVSVFFWAFGGVGAALLFMALPWACAVLLSRMIRRFGLMYWLLIGAVLTVLFGCAASSLAPKPLFIEDQTFVEGFLIALQRQGICLALMGLLFGLTYWYLSERGRPVISTASL